MLKTYDPITDDYVVYGGQRLNINSDTLITPFDDPRGLDLHRYGKFSSRSGKEIRNIVIHWEGLILSTAITYSLQEMRLHTLVLVLTKTVRL